ncbi:hypothetical protein DLJ53_14325 [Acuticoccus sediminis]|uniref:Solute-binding protein family 3/N-terminal domain-containing protein n=1 Tax=Acuticoccus sediminis TaxID=2184697 RepID=A0A8B2NP32_9HYPH|nr:transporter substrate-binding domain-containing protein [Acuticoccus sediminis]RAI00442.1 hypothetical protein DLJ53_14325 [Acuticoccus sediminis]
MRRCIAGLIALTLSTTLAAAQTLPLSPDTAAGAAAIGLSGPPTQSDRDIEIADSETDQPAAGAPAPEAAGAEPGTGAAAPVAAAPGTAGASEASPAAAESGAEDSDEPDSAATAAGALGITSPPDEPDDEGAEPDTAATAAGALGITSPPEQPGEAGDEPDGAATAAGALGITSPPEAADGGEGTEPDSAATAAGALGINSPPDQSGDGADDGADAAATAAGALGISTPPDTSGSDQGASDAAAAAGALSVTAPSISQVPATTSAPTYAVAILDDAPPFSYLGRFRVRTGFDVDLANALCRTMQARCELMPMSAEDIVQALVDRRVAFAVATTAITAQPGASISFTEPYLGLTVRFVTPRDRRRDVEDDDATYGAIAGTAQAEYLRKLYRDPQAVHLYPNADGMWIDLALGRLDGVLSPAITARREFLSTPIGDGFRFSSAASDGENNLARTAVIGVGAQAGDLVRSLNEALDRMRDSGEFDELLARHLDSDLVTKVGGRPTAGR